ncbi:MAG: aminopeptidase [Anaerolineales bacterium]
MKTQDFDQKLEKYAELIVKVGLNLQPEQRLFLTAISLDVAPLVRQVVKSAYKNGSRLVSVLWLDEQLDKIRHQNAPRDSFEEFPTWRTDGELQCIERGDANLYIVGRNPELLKDQDPKLVAIAARTVAKNNKPILGHLGKNSIQWSCVASPTPDWAIKVFPDNTPQDAEARLWDAVFKACRIDEPDPAVFWEKHLDNLEKRAKYLTDKQYSALQFTGLGTNLTVGLPEGHIWGGAKVKTPSNISFVANLPTEEVFTLPHKNKIEGTVTATKPLSYQGNLIENFSFTFSEGKVVNFSAEKGEETLRNLLETDEHAKSLGEVALVPHQTPISQLDLIFLNTIYDENASNHLALGNAYRFTLVDGKTMSDEEFEQAGGNDSLIHVDFMFGSGEMDVDGLLADGVTEPVMRAGEWAFDL